MRILVVDDHVLFREGVASLLDTQPDMEVLGEAASAEEAVIKARELKPDVILMDISMPGGDGLKATRQILAEYPEINIVFLTVHEDDEILFEAIKSGGKGYLLKNMRTADIIKLLRGLERGEAAISGAMAGRILSEFARMRTKLAAVSDEAIDDIEFRITSREKEVLQLIAAGASNKKIAEQLVVAESTVKNHVSNILAKLHLKNRRAAAAFARSHNLTDHSKSSPSQSSTN